MEPRHANLFPCAVDCDQRGKLAGKVHVYVFQFSASLRPIFPQLRPCLPCEASHVSRYGGRSGATRPRGASDLRHKHKHKRTATASTSNPTKRQGQDALQEPRCREIRTTEQRPQRKGRRRLAQVCRLSRSHCPFHLVSNITQLITRSTFRSCRKAPAIDVLSGHGSHARCPQAPSLSSSLRPPIDLLASKPSARSSTSWTLYFSSALLP